MHLLDHATWDLPLKEEKKPDYQGSTVQNGCTVLRLWGVRFSMVRAIASVIGSMGVGTSCGRLRHLDDGGIFKRYGCGCCLVSRALKFPPTADTFLWWPILRQRVDDATIRCPSRKNTIVVSFAEPESINHAFHEKGYLHGKHHLVSA